jgi:hypothetical protein
MLNIFSNKSKNYNQNNYLKYAIFDLYRTRTALADSIYFRTGLRIQEEIGFGAGFNITLRVLVALREPVAIKSMVF